MTEAEAIAAAVASRMEQLDEAFLVALGAYCNAAQQQGNIALAGEHKVMVDVVQALPGRKAAFAFTHLNSALFHPMLRRSAYKFSWLSHHVQLVRHSPFVIRRVRLIFQSSFL